MFTATALNVAALDVAALVWQPWMWQRWEQQLAGRRVAGHRVAVVRSMRQDDAAYRSAPGGGVAVSEVAAVDRRLSSSRREWPSRAGASHRGA